MSRGAVALADDTEPRPDLAVLRHGAVPYKDRDAWAEDALLVIEVAESSLAYDRSTKMRLYAEANIPEYWGSWTAPRNRRGAPGARPGWLSRRQPGGRRATLTLQAFPDIELRTTDVFA